MSTSALIGRRPIARRRFCSQAGDGPFVTPRTTRPAKNGALAATPASIVTPTGQGKAPGTASIVTAFNVPRPRAARSRATPWTPRASGRFGVILMWIIGSILSGAFCASQSTKR